MSDKVKSVRWHSRSESINDTNDDDDDDNNFFVNMKHHQDQTVGKKMFIVQEM